MTARFLVLVMGACQVGKGVGGFATNFVHSSKPLCGLGDGRFEHIFERRECVTRRLADPTIATTLLQAVAHRPRCVVDAAPQRLEPAGPLGPLLLTD